MRIPRLVVPLLSVAILAGCNNKPPPKYENVKPAQESAFNQIRAQYARLKPDARVGLVTDSDKKNELVAVSEVNPREFHIEQIVTLIDSNENPLTTGHVVRILPSSIHVKYDPPPSGRREPRDGDIMVRFKPAF